VKALIKHRNKLVEGNRKEYGNQYDTLKWVGYYEGMEMEQQRQEIIDSLNGTIEWTFHNTKTDATRLSPGCQLCGQGQWSCLFINGKCNCNCFYCPTSQNNISLPETQTLTFDDPMTYVAYIKKFGFKGISFSGGEPFLTFDRVRNFLTVIRRELPPDIYVWMYTNGTKVTLDHLKELRNLGLNEIRYDIGATNYNLKPVMQAIGIIPTVTVEIPAVPDEMETLKDCVKQLADAGLSHINLHQMRLTPHNMLHLAERGYTFAHGVRATVPASELTALEILRFTKENNINLPVNYCSFVFKNRFQKSGLRKKIAPFIAGASSEITENGYIRQLWAPLTDDIEKSDHLASMTIDKAQQKVFFQLDALSKLMPLLPSFNVSYTDVRFNNHSTETNHMMAVPLTDTTTVYLETANVSGSLTIGRDEYDLFMRITQNNASIDDVSDDERLFAIWGYECIEKGLSEIY
jgi:pyruvate formate-lyase activating enzyme-like uncharacterized protein